MAAICPGLFYHDCTSPGNARLFAAGWQSRAVKEMITSAREAVLELHRKHPCLFLREIGDKVGITRERVRQILKAERITERGKSKRGRFFTCNDCGRLYRFSYVAGSNSKIYCSSCFPTRKGRTYITLVCEICGTEFPRELSLVKKRLCGRGGQHIFCHKHCQGKWLAAEVERRHPGHLASLHSNRIGKSKYAHLLPQIEEMLKTKTKTQVTSELGIGRNWLYLHYPKLLKIKQESP